MYPKQVDMRERRWLLRGAAIVIGVAALAALPLILFNNTMPRMNAINCVILVICSFLGFIIANVGRFDIGGYFIAGALMYCISTIPPELLMDGPLSVTYIIAIAIGGIAGGARAVWVLSGLSITLYVALGILSGIWTVNSFTAVFTIVTTMSIVGIIMQSYERALRGANRQAETESQLEHERHMRTLIRSLQHELKAQANGVQGLVRIARTVPYGEMISPDDWETVVLRGLEVRAQRLDTMMQHLLVISRGQLPDPQEYQTVPLRSLFADVKAESIGWEYEIQVSISVEIADSLYIRCLPTYLQMAIDTIVRNSVEASLRTGKGAVHISVWAEIVDDSIVIYIHDNGPGYPVAVINQVNQAQQNEHTLLVPSSKGATGLGISLLRAIILFHGGTVAIGNDLGAWVKIRLPQE